jgi:hypothetical protein
MTKGREGKLKLRESLTEIIKETWRCFACSQASGEAEGAEGCLRPFVRSWYGKGPWFFPEWGGVKGFFGDGGKRRAMFIAPRPSTGRFPDEPVKQFYGALRDSGFQDAHLTDIVKCRGEAGEPPEEMVENCLRYLLEEAKLVKPRLIVIVGKSYERRLRKIAQRLEEELGYEVSKEVIHHYSLRGRWNEKCREGIRLLAKKYPANESS